MTPPNQIAYALTRGTVEPLTGLQQEEEGQEQQAQKQLSRIYQSYAELYPNPQLTQERLERDRLLQQVRLELQQELQQERAKDEQVKPAEEKAKKGSLFGFLFGRSKTVRSPNLAGTEDNDIEEDDYLVYSTDTSSSLQDDDCDTLCGTQSILDDSCIPPEAHSMARFHLSSPSGPIAVRRDASSPIVLITDVGVVAQLVDDTWQICHTSDKPHWENRLAKTDEDLRKTRATLIGSDCLAVSWGGLQDVILYRRGPDVWDAVAYFTPTPAVLDNLQSQSHVYVNEDLLRVTDLATLLVERDGGGMAATLVVSRLGGYIELVPLYDQLWRHQPPAKTRKNKRAAELFHISSEHCNIAPMTTGDHLDDLLHLEVYRTSVGADTEWDVANEHPPAEYLLVASGTKDGEARVTFWAVATVFSDNPDEQFGLHIVFLEEYSVGAIGQVTIFANQGIMEHWRRPRRVERREQMEQQPTLPSPQLGTLSATVPVVSMRFKPVGSSLFLSVLDWNGGVLILDCTAALKKASQTLPAEQLEALNGSITSISRSEIRRHLCGHKVIDVGWSKRGELVLATPTNKLHVLVIDQLSSESAVSSVLALPIWMTGNGKLVEAHDCLTVLLPRKFTLVAAELQTASPAATVATCHKRLWEQARRIDDLAAVSDNSYVIEQVVAMFRGELDAEGLDMASCREACRIALERCSTLRVAEALQLSDEVETLKAKLGQWSVRAGTYSLLCEHFEADEEINTFLEKFVNGPLFDLASNVAAKGDMKGLSILLTRHHEELLADRLTILDKIPLTTDPSEYSHLLPVCEDEHDGAVEETSIREATWLVERAKRMQEVLGTRPSEDESLLSYCISLLDKKRTEGESEARTVNDIRESIGACVAIAKASRSSLRQSERMIKSRECMLELFLALSEHLAESCHELRLLASDARYLLGKLWQAYECLPLCLAPHEKSNDELVHANDRVDSLFRSLIAADILIPWSPKNALATLSNKEVNGSDIASTMCSAFCNEIGIRNTPFESKAKRLHDLTSDLLQLRIDACQSSLDLKPPLHEVLLMGLLHQGEFELFAEVFSTELSDIADWERMQPAVLNFVNEIMIGDSNSRFSFETDKVHMAIQCQDILASRFPQLQEAFRGMRRHLDAAHFINTVLSTEEESLSPSELRDMLPFDVIEHVLRENPLCFLQGCNEWENNDFGRARNRELLSFYLSRGNPDASMTMPSLPGGAVIQLANIVGLESRISRLLVQNRVAHYAKLVSMPWVTAAIALAMINEKSVHAEENELKMATIALVASEEAYDDVVLKAILFREALRLSPIQITSSFDSVIKALAGLEHKVSRFCPSRWEPDQAAQSQIGQAKSQKQGNSGFLVLRAVEMLAHTATTMANDDGAPTRPRTLLDRVLSPRPIDRVFQDTLRGYSKDLNSLFQILQDKASNGTGDDPLLVVIGRFFLFWCISNSVRISEHDHRGTFEQADALGNLALAASVFLHSQDSEAVLSNLEEMKEIAETQSLCAIEQVAGHPRLDPIRPDLAIVRKLVGLGYTENGARRAAVATNNESQQAAMVWAVAHSLEPSFNSPLIFVKPPRNPHVDQIAIRNVKRCLYDIDSRFKGTMSARPMAPTSHTKNVDYAHLSLSLLPKSSTATVAEDGTGERAFPTKTDKAKKSSSQRQILLSLAPQTRTATVSKDGAGERSVLTKGAIAKTSSSQRQTRPQTRSLSTANASVPPAPLRALPSKGNLPDPKATKPRPPSPPPPPHVEATPVAAPSPMLRQAQPPPSSLPPPRVEATNVAAPSPMMRQARSSPILRQAPPPPPSSLQPPHVEATSVAAPSPLLRQAPPPPPSSLQPPHVEAGTAPSLSLKQPPPPPPPPKSAPAVLLHLIDRSALRKTGESVRLNSRGVSNLLDHDERKRLLSKGRKLFEKARSSPIKLPQQRSTPPKFATPPKFVAPPAKVVVPPPKVAVPYNADLQQDDGWDFDSPIKAPAQRAAAPPAKVAAPSKVEVAVPPDNDDLQLDDGWDFDDF